MMFAALFRLFSALPLICTLLISVTTNAHASLQTGLLAEYSFEHNLNDSSGNARHGTSSGGVGYTTGTSGSALQLDGIDDVISLPADLWIDGFSTSFFVRTTAVAPVGTNWWQGLGIVDGETCGSPVGGDFGIALINGGHLVTANVATTAEINDGAFHSVVVTRSSVTDSVKTYIDGVLDVSYALSFTGFTGMPWIGVGNNPCDAGFNRGWFAGAVDELRFYDRVLTPAEVTQLAGPTVVANPATVTAITRIEAVFPNPSTGRTSLRFTLRDSGPVRLAIYDLRGRRIRKLDLGELDAGSHARIWNGRDDKNRAVAAGVYFVTLRAADQESTRKLLRVR